MVQTRDPLRPSSPPLSLTDMFLTSSGLPWLSLGCPSHCAPRMPLLWVLCGPRFSVSWNCASIWHICTNESQSWSSLPLPQIMTDLGAILSSSPPPPTHVRKLCSSLLTKSLLRPGGIRALFAAVFGEQDTSDDLQLEKYERTANILMTVPAALKPEVGTCRAFCRTAEAKPSIPGLLCDDHSSPDGVAIQ